MEFMDNDFTNSNGVAQFSSSHPYFHHHALVDHHPSMSSITTPVAHFSSHHHLPTSTFNLPLTTPSAELCHRKPDKSGGRKRKRGNNEGVAEGLNPSDVIHVRVKRGQATDSHSLAERVRRKKINEKLQSLHDIVPGCHKKTMGMAIMLDVVIKYIQSLQNQIEFLSMKLLPASLFRDLNSSDGVTVGTMLDPVHGHGAAVQEMERLVAEGYGTEAPYFNSTLFPQESLQNE